MRPLISLFGGVGLGTSLSGMCLAMDKSQTGSAVYLVFALLCFVIILFDNFFLRGSATARVRLEREDFRALIRGGEVKRDNAKIILADIGYDSMLDELHEAIWKETP